MLFSRTQIFTGLVLCASSLVCLALPTIETQPVSKLDVPVDEVVMFEVGASGDSLEYQWRLNGVNIPGATDTKYIIDKVGPFDGGDYTVAVNDKDGSVLSKVAKLTLNLPIIDKNDNFSGAGVLQDEKGQTEKGAIRSYNCDATRQLGEPKHANKTGTNSVWFKWIAPTNGIATFRTSGSSFDTLLAVYTGEFGQLIPPSGAINDDDRGGFLTSLVSFNATERTQYFIAVDGLLGACGEIVLSWNLEPTIDQLPEISDSPQSRNVPPGDTITINVRLKEGSNDTIKWLFQGQPVEGKDTPGLLIDKIDDKSVGFYTALVEREGRDAIRRSFSDRAHIQINLTDGVCDTNVTSLDKFSEAQEIDSKRGLTPSGKTPVANAGPARGYTTTQIFSTVGSSKEPGEPNHCGQAGGASEWFTYSAPATGRLHIDTYGSSYNTILAVYTQPGFSMSDLVPVDCNNAAGNGGDNVRFNATSGTLYYIAVDGVGGASGTVVLNLNLGDAPSFSMANKFIAAGANLNYSPTVSGTIPMTYQWKFNGVAIPGATTNVFTKTNMQPADAGTYSLTCSNAIDVTTVSSVVTVGPLITAHPVGQSANPGSNVTFSVTASGSPTLRYQWQKGASPLLNATNSILTITNVQAINAGSYFVTVTNLAGTAISSNAVLTVNAAPAITNQPSGKTVTPGTNPSLLVGASGIPAPKYQWFFNNVSISNATNATLIVTNFQSTNEGTYRVTASNSLGSVTSSNAILKANSPMKVGDFAFGTNGTFQLQVIGIATTNYIFQCSSNLVNWDSLATNSSPDGFLIFTDTNAAINVLRFYRAITQ